jgi:hypothetical protein
VQIAAHGARNAFAQRGLQRGLGRLIGTQGGDIKSSFPNGLLLAIRRLGQVHEANGREV